MKMESSTSRRLLIVLCALIALYTASYSLVNQTRSATKAWAARKRMDLEDINRELSRRMADVEAELQVSAEYGFKLAELAMDETDKLVELAEMEIHLGRAPSVLIVVLLHDAAENLHQMIESLVELSFPHSRLSLAFVDLGSVDDTMMIINQAKAKLKSSFNRVVVFEEAWHSGPHHKNDILKYGTVKNKIIRKQLKEEAFVLWVNPYVLRLPPDLIDLFVTSGKDVISTNVTLFGHHHHDDEEQDLKPPKASNNKKNDNDDDNEPEEARFQKRNLKSKDDTKQEKGAQHEPHQTASSDTGLGGYPDEADELELPYDPQVDPLRNVTVSIDKVDRERILFIRSNLHRYGILYPYSSLRPSLKDTLSSRLSHFGYKFFSLSNVHVLLTPSDDEDEVPEDDQS